MQHVASSDATHAEPAHVKVPALHFCFLPALGHAIDEHFALFTQQLSTLVRPSVAPSLSESWYLPVPQGTLVFLHLVLSFSQQAVRSAVTHVPAAQYKSPAAAFCLSPAAQVIDEHFALFAQHVASSPAG
jgi:hypothetical protein